MLETAVFLCGAVIMVIELTGSRVLAPYLGTSLVVWTSLIGIILASLSLGYWWGGRLADRRPEARLLGGLILLASLATAAIALTKSFVLAYLQSKVTGLHMAAVLTLASWLAARSEGRQNDDRNRGMGGDQPNCYKLRGSCEDKRRHSHGRRHGQPRGCGDRPVNQPERKGSEKQGERIPRS